MRLTKCRICRTPYQKWSITQKVCSNIACAIEQVKLDKLKKARKDHADAKVTARPRREWLKLAQQAFNQFIRARDEKLPCISCGRHHTGQYHAGHYFTTGARPELRFDESNCHKQCAPCNNHLSGNIALYRVNLIKKIGIDRVEWLEGPHGSAKWQIPELQGIIKEYRGKLKGLKL
jgi:hypothetical protein